MSESVREVVLDLEPVVTADNGRAYHSTVVGHAAVDGHWNVSLEFVALDSQQVLRTGVESHQATEADLHHWAGTLGDVYLRGALDRATLSSSETAAHRRAIDQASIATRERAGALDPFELFALGEHVLRRELLLFKRAALRTLIITHKLNPAGLDLSKFTKAQLVTFIVTAIEAQASRPRA